MTGRRRSATLVILCLLGAALAWLWSEDARRAGDVAAPGVLVVAGSQLPVPVGPSAAKLPVDYAIARSERDAAVPPSGGPGPEDTRPRTIPAAVRAGRLAEGARLIGTGPAFAAAGFSDGDLLTSVDGRPVVSMPEGIDVAALLIPGAMIEVRRGGDTIAWRIGGKAE